MIRGGADVAWGGCRYDTGGVQVRHGGVQVWHGGGAGEARGGGRCGTAGGQGWHGGRRCGTGDAGVVLPSFSTPSPSSSLPCLPRSGTEGVQVRYGRGVAGGGGR